MPQGLAVLEEATLSIFDNLGPIGLLVGGPLGYLAGRAGSEVFGAGQAPQTSTTTTHGTQNSSQTTNQNQDWTNNQTTNQQSGSTSNQNYNNYGESGVRMGEASFLEALGLGASVGGFANLAGLYSQGPSGADYSAGIDAQRGLANLYNQYAQTGGMPGQQDVSMAQGFAKSIFDAQRTALDLSFRDQLQQANAQAASMGRDINDPVLRAKLLQEQTRQQTLLGSQERSYASQLAMALPGQRLGYAAQGADLRAQLGNQAIQNQLALLGMGQQFLGGERDWRFRTGTQFQSGSGTSFGSQTGYSNSNTAGSGQSQGTTTSLGSTVTDGTQTTTDGGGFLSGLGALMGFAGGLARMGGAMGGRA